MPDIKLGQEVRDVVCGLQGIVTGIAVALHGNTRVSIQPPMLDGKVSEPEWVDDVGVEVVDAIAQTGRAVTIVHDSAALLGKKVRDLVTGFEGTVISAAMYLNGCLRHEVEPTFRPDIDADLNVSRMFDAGRLMEVGGAAPVAVQQTRTGGPRTRGKP